MGCKYLLVGLLLLLDLLLDVFLVLLELDVLALKGPKFGLVLPDHLGQVLELLGHLAKIGLHLSVLRLEGAAALHFSRQLVLERLLDLKKKNKKKK